MATRPLSSLPEPSLQHRRSQSRWLDLGRFEQIDASDASSRYAFLIHIARRQPGRQTNKSFFSISLHFSLRSSSVFVVAFVASQKPLVPALQCDATSADLEVVRANKRAASDECRGRGDGCLPFDSTQLLRSTSRIAMHHTEVKDDDDDDDEDDDEREEKDKEKENKRSWRSPHFAGIFAIFLLFAPERGIHSHSMRRRPFHRISPRIGSLPRPP